MCGPPFHLSLSLSLTPHAHAAAFTARLAPPRDRKRVDSRGRFFTAALTPAARGTRRCRSHSSTLALRRRRSRPGQSTAKRDAWATWVCSRRGRGTARWTRIASERSAVVSPPRVGLRSGRSIGVCPSGRAGVPRARDKTFSHYLFYYVGKYGLHGLPLIHAEVQVRCKYKLAAFVWPIVVLTSPTRLAQW